MNRISVLTWSLLLLLFAACDRYVAFNPPAAEEFPPNLQELAPDLQLESDTLPMLAEEGDTLEFPGGVILILPGNCLVTAGGGPCTGTVHVTLLQIFSRKDILLAGQPTLSGSNLLETGGQFYLNVTTESGEPLRFRSGQFYQLKVPVKRTKANPERMQFFTGNTSGGRTFGWQFSGELAARDASHYTIAHDEVDRWLSCAYAYTRGKPNTRLTLLPEGEPVSADEVRLFMLFRSIHSVITLIPLDNRFEAAGELPAGQEVSLVGISRKDGKLLVGRQDATVQPAMEVRMPFREVSEAELNRMLDEFK